MEENINCMEENINYNSTYEYIRGIYDERKDDGSFWHYTSLNSIISMFDEYIKKDNKDKKNVTNCSVWASNVRYMNDPGEYREGRELFKKLVKKYYPSYAPILKDRYCLISFSEKGDNLGHWKWYGKESGVSVCFNMNYIESSIYKKDAPQKYDSNNRPIRVYYSKNEKDNYFKKLSDAEKSNKISIKSLEALFVPFCKDESYLEESEYRMVFYENNDGNLDYAYNKNEVARTKPALNVKMRLLERSKNDLYYLDSMGVKKECPKKKDNIISSLVVGPGMNQELVFNALIHIFDTENYRYVEFQENEQQRGRKKLMKNLKKGEFGWVLDSNDINGKERFAYKCYNGISIIKSGVVFRG